jgi:acetylornithine deacetylase
MRDQIIDLTSRLVAIDSVNPALIAGGAGEREIADLVLAWARAAGLDAERLEATPGRPSVLVRARGRGGGRSLLLCGHTDTVGVEGMPDPHRPRVDGDRLYGRGAYDMKGGLAAALLACRAAAELDLAGDVVVAAVADEEHASLGVQEALAALTEKPAAAVVTEPTELELVVAHKGFAWSEIEVAGRAAHGSRPDLGVDAIVKSGPVLTALGRLDAELGASTHPLLGRGSVHASLVRGGEELSSYPERCVVTVERRTLPGETSAHVEAELERVLDSARAEDPQLNVTQRTLLVRDPHELSRDSDVLAVVRDAAAEVLPAPPPVTGVSYWADAAFIGAAGIPTVMFGPSGVGAHALDEWVDIADTVAVTRALTRVAERVCAGEG